MSTAPAKSMSAVTGPEPAWEIATLFPAQGQWSVEEYLMLKGNHLVEFSSGHVEVLPMPTELHQMIVAYLYGVLLSFACSTGAGKVLFAPLRVRVAAEKFREPDLVFMLAAHDARRNNEFWEGADLVVEVVSEDNRSHDLETKRREYAEAAIPEYWIVDPQKREIIVLKLVGDHYEEHGIFRDGNRATSLLLPGFEVAVTETFDVK